ncbi:MAG: divalent-cation tolerance protein CutA [Gammaproteobacteria bacterium]
MSFIIILNTCPDKKTAQEIAEKLIENKLAACVNILPKGISVYCWQGKVESTEENLLLIKTHQDQFLKVETIIKSLHPYELPEVMAVPVTLGSKDYLDWLSQSLDQCEDN